MPLIIPSKAKRRLFAKKYSQLLSPRPAGIVHREIFIFSASNLIFLPTPPENVLILNSLWYTSHYFFVTEKEQVILWASLRENTKTARAFRFSRSAPLQAKRAWESLQQSDRREELGTSRTTTTTTTIFISCPENFYSKNKYMQCEKITMKNRAQPLRNS